MLLSSRQSLKENEKLIIKNSAEHLWFLRENESVPQYAGNYEDNTVVVTLLDETVNGMRKTKTGGKPNKRARLTDAGASQSSIGE